jgi:hypothetical protein
MADWIRSFSLSESMGIIMEDKLKDNGIDCLRAVQTQLVRMPQI